MRSISDRARVALVGLALVGLAGCPKFSNDGLACGAGDACPPGYHCAVDKRCWKSNQNPGANGSDLSASVSGDLGGTTSSRDLNGIAPGSDLAGAASSPPDLSPILGMGQLCGSGADCISHNCVDGVCCDMPCASSCTSCNQATNLGHCTPVASGATPSHGTCGPDTMMSCLRNGKCDGAGNCQKWDSTTLCGSASCTTMFTAAPRCDGNGKCVTPNPQPCDPYVCKPDKSGCYTSCTAGSTECKTATCNAGSCGPRANGQPCAVLTQATDCVSGNCVDLVCCDMTAASCSGCKACNLGTPGTCANIPSGDPHNVCPTNASNCVAGGCTSGSCAPSTGGTICASSCMSTNMLSLSKCSGAATGCPAAGAPMACAGNLVCADGASCKQSCGADGDCLSGYWCNVNNCAARGDPGAACTPTALCTSTSCDQCKANAPCTTFYQDADGDTYGDPNKPAGKCGTSPPAGYTAAAMATDCCDVANDASNTAFLTNPAQTTPQVAKNACGSWDYNCDGTPSEEFGATIGSCTTRGSCKCADPYGCSYQGGWVGADPGCGGTGNWLMSCGTFGACPCTCADTSNHCGGSCDQSRNISAARTQRCL